VGIFSLILTYYFLEYFIMHVVISGNAGKTTEFKDIDRRDGNGSFSIAENSLAVKVTKDGEPDWYKLKFRGDRMINASSYIQKGSVQSVTGKLTFEDWIDADGNRVSKGVVTVRELQLPRKSVEA
jgi:single-stranded DNA-binding protein